MYKLSNDQNVICFDVDDTLILWNPQEKGIVTEIECPYRKKSYCVWPHRRHIEFLKREHGKGNAVVVWSRSGQKWAEAVVKHLGLTEYVDLVMCKPIKYVDDKKDADSIIGMHVYLDTDGKSV